MLRGPIRQCLPTGENLNITGEKDEIHACVEYLMGGLFESVHGRRD